jgi:NAD+ kinase
LGCEVFLEAETAENTTITQIPSIAAKDFQSNIDLVIVLGGDGTMLGIARQIAGQDVPLIGINMGTLGYMTDIPLQDVELVLTEMLKGHHESDSRYLLEAEVYRNDQIIGTGSALNDVVVNRSGISGMLELTVRVNGQFMYNQRSDGLIVATPTGSTAYSMSARGPILSPRLRAILMTPVSPHMLFDRSMVLDPQELIRIEVLGHRSVNVATDGELVHTLRPGDIVEVRAAQEVARFVRFKEQRFHQTLKSKFGLSDR